MIFGNNFLFKKNNFQETIILKKGSTVVEEFTTTEQNVVFRNLEFGTYYTILVNNQEVETFIIDIKEIILTNIIPFITDENIKKEFTDFLSSDKKDDFYTMLNKIVKSMRNFSNLSYVLDLTFEEEKFDKSKAFAIKQYVTMIYNMLNKITPPEFSDSIQGSVVYEIENKTDPVPLGERFTIKAKRRVIVSGLS